MDKQWLPIIAGPTASGKTALAIALATRRNGEIISADSMQIYDEIAIGTARPKADEQDGIPHHLLGFVPLSRAFSVAEYTALAHQKIADVATRGKQPILCGGTGLYIQSVAEDLRFSDEPSGDAERLLRVQLQQRAQEEGGETLLAELASIDPDTANRLHPNDIGRIVRALELFARTGRTVTEQNRLSRAQPSRYNVRMVVLNVRDRAFLYERINRRVDLMLQNGLLTEAERVLNSPYAPTAMQAIGYKELAPYFAGDISLDEAVEHIKRSTRRYAKRQLSWFRRVPYATHLYIDDYADTSALCEAAERHLFT